MTCRGANDFKWMDVIFHVEKKYRFGTKESAFRVKMEALKKDVISLFFNLSYSV